MLNFRFSIENIKDYLSVFFKKGNIRSIKAKRNILASFFIKGISIAISLVMVPLTIHYVNPTQYGIWLTLSSIVGWLSFFDIGFTNGFRNKFAIARSNGDSELAKYYVSTIYAVLSIIFIAVWFLFLAANTWINWTKILNVDQSLEKEISLIALIIFSYFCIQFVLKILNTILNADQKPAIASLIDTLSQIVSLFLVFLLTQFTKGSLLNLSIALSAAPILVLIIATIWFFKNEYKNYRPSFKFVRFKYAKDILNLGLKFFVIQISGIVQYQTTNFIIAHFFGTYEVTSYNIAYKYFFVLNMMFSIILLPYWSAVTEAYSKSDFEWIKNTRIKYLKIWRLFLIVGILMLTAAPVVYNLWIGKGVVIIPFSLSFWTFIFAITAMFAGIHISIINGIGAIKIQFYMCLITPIIFLVSSYVLVRFFSFGISAILIASVLSNVNGFIFAPIQTNRILKGKKGIWIK